MVAENAAIGGALVDSLYLHHKRLAEVFRYFDKDIRCDFSFCQVFVLHVFFAFLSSEKVHDLSVH
jgi:hypothetical protein